MSAPRLRKDGQKSRSESQGSTNHYDNPSEDSKSEPKVQEDKKLMQNRIEDIKR